MKKTIFLGLALLGLAAFTQAAALTVGGTINAPNVQQDGNGILVLKTYSVDPSGTPIATPAAAPGIIAGFTPTVYVNVLSVPTSTPVTTPVPVAPVSVKIHKSGRQTFTWNQTPVAYNISHVAGVASQGYILRMEGMPGPCAAAALEIDYSTSASSALNSGWGAYIPASTTGGIAYGPYGGTPTAKMRSLSSSECHGSFVVESLP